MFTFWGLCFKHLKEIIINFPWTKNILTLLKRVSFYLQSVLIWKNWARFYEASSLLSKASNLTWGMSSLVWKASKKLIYDGGNLNAYLASTKSCICQLRSAMGFRCCASTFLWISGNSWLMWIVRMESLVEIFEARI